VKGIELPEKEMYSSLKRRAKEGETAIKSSKNNIINNNNIIIIIKFPPVKYKIIASMPYNSY